MKALAFCGRSRAELLAFPADVLKAAGYQLYRVQSGLEPVDWKPMTSIGSGVNEIRLRDQTGAFRVVYIARFDEAVYVLTCFQKKTEKTSRHDLELAGRRYRDLMKERGI